MGFLIILNLILLYLYMLVHKRLTLLSKELEKVSHETGYSLWKLEHDLINRFEVDEWNNVKSAEVTD